VDNSPWHHKCSGSCFTSSTLLSDKANQKLPFEVEPRRSYLGVLSILQDPTETGEGGKRDRGTLHCLNRGYPHISRIKIIWMWRRKNMGWIRIRSLPGLRSPRCVGSNRREKTRRVTLISREEGTARADQTPASARHTLPSQAINAKIWFLWCHETRTQGNTLPSTCCLLYSYFMSDYTSYKQNSPWKQKNMMIFVDIFVRMREWLHGNKTNRMAGCRRDKHFQES